MSGQAQALTFTLRDRPAQSVDVSPLIPDRLQGKSADDIAAIELTSGNRKLRIGELFSIEGADAANIAIRNSCSKLNRIGLGMSGGSITVQGDAGAYLGMGMKNGRIVVSGSAGAWAASGMANGQIDIRGDAGDFLGAAIQGDKQGMQGGTVIVHGNAGDRAGDHLRRGMLLIRGNAGVYCASRMLAGTIVVGGQAGAGAGFGMKRGTLILSRPASLPATFNDCGIHNLSFLNLLHRHFRSSGGEVAQFARDGYRVRRFMGDLGNGGSGEILLYV